MNVTIEVERVWSKLVFPWKHHRSIVGAFHRPLTAEVEGAKYTWKYKSGEWDGKVQVYKDQSDRYIGGSILILTGLVPLVAEALKTNKIQVTYVDKRGITTPTLTQTNVQLRDYQLAAVTSMIGNSEPGLGWFPQGILHAATGSGKTEMAVALYDMHRKPTTFLVHRKDLLLQAEERFSRYGIIPGVVGASRFNIQPGSVNICTMQTISSAMSKPNKKTDDIVRLMRDTEQVFFDEAHLMASSVDKGNQFIQIAGLFDNAYARWGLTATPFMRDKYDNLLLMGTTGKVLYSVKNAELIDRGFLTTPTVKMLKVPGNMPIRMQGKRSSKNTSAYWKTVHDQGIKFNQTRTNLLMQEVTSGPCPMLVLVTTIDQGEYLQKLLAAKGTSVPMLTGQTKAKERRQAVADLDSGAIDCLIATTIFDEGVDIPNLRKVVLASGGKSHVKLLQRAGRGLRLAQGKHSVEIVDFMDAHHPMLMRHSQERKKVWDDEGFMVVVK